MYYLSRSLYGKRLLNELNSLTFRCISRMLRDRPAVALGSVPPAGRITGLGFTMASLPFRVLGFA